MDDVIRAGTVTVDELLEAALERERARRAQCQDLVDAERARLRQAVEALARYTPLTRYMTPAGCGDWIRRAEVLELLEGAGRDATDRTRGAS
jgi:hypothetical protein